MRKAVKRKWFVKLCDGAQDFNETLETFTESGFALHSWQQDKSDQGTVFYTVVFRHKTAKG